jgi:hypothetical protein
LSSSVDRKKFNKVNDPADGAGFKPGIISIGGFNIAMFNLENLILFKVENIDNTISKFTHYK